MQLLHTPERLEKILQPILTLTLIVLNTLTCFALPFSAAFAAENHEKAVAELISASGDVLIKEPGSTLWLAPEGFNRKFRAGTRIQTGADGKVLLRYFFPRTVIEISPFSQIQIEANARKAIQVQRIFQNAAHDPASQENRRENPGEQPLLRIVEKPILESELDGTAQGTSDRKQNPLSLDPKSQSGRVYVAPMGIAFPSQRVTLVVSGLPGLLPITLETKYKTTPIWTYVWGEKDRTPRDRIYGRGGPTRLALGLGRYVVQLFCEDDSCASPPLEVNVIQQNPITFFAQVDLKSERHDSTVIVQ